ncbi:Methyltransferase domain-containing protein [Roseateles sp. YR242]|uniref:class I SAM-dependent methyltransferase n=1 Tax=Roseateles sp. YR242 TaxID=1855305 RepID=UPI0008B17C39|nr:SAM-dependent methyltransferase [Roseateles sp. YR242]SEK98194.1 Methyltransferase domain-containing protein [Roseateles sp. YR242]
MFSSLVSPAPDDRAAPDERERFLRLLSTAVAERRLQRLLLSKYQGEGDVERLTVRLIELRGEAALSFLWRHATKDITRNHTLEAGVAEITTLLGQSFGQANLDTEAQEVQLRFSRKGKPLLHVTRRPDAERPVAEGSGPQDDRTEAQSPEPSVAGGHDREKPRALSLGSPFWRELGVTHEVKGRVDLVPAMARKWKQINKFIEIFGAAVRHAGLSAPGTPVRLADFGSGKGYLTFAMHDYLQSVGLAPDVQGVELRQDMVTLGNDAVKRHTLKGLRFEQGDVRQREDIRLDVMVALHACDIATDYAMHVGLRSGARIIMCAPCCHKEVRPQIRTPAALRPLLQHGIHLGQEAEMVTDSVRALLLELMGYDTQVIEFIALEHTSKNKMVLAVKRPQGLTAARRAELLAQLHEIKQFYGLRQQTLETLLREDGRLADESAAG